jgi:hypothetical protein
MVENLTTVRYCNGDLTLPVKDTTEWSALTTGAFCNYNNDVSKSAAYGRLYNWYAINDSRNLAPIGLVSTQPHQKDGGFDSVRKGLINLKTFSEIRESCLL